MIGCGMNTERSYDCLWYYRMEIVRLVVVLS